MADKQNKSSTTKNKTGSEFYINGNRYERAVLLAHSGDGKTAFVKSNGVKKSVPAIQLYAKPNN